MSGGAAAEPGVDEEIAARLGHLVAMRDPGAVVRRVTPLAGGASSLTYLADLELDARRWRAVVKLAPPGLAPVGNRDVLRQAALLRTLTTGSRVPVPSVIGEDAGDPPGVPPLFAMEYVDGEASEPHFDVDARPRWGAEPIARRARHAAELLVTLHAIDAGQVFPEEPLASGRSEIERWSRALATVDQELVAGWERCRDALLASEPPALPAVVVHGDYRLGNMLARADRVVAIVDWELWGTGDPRLDLSWLRLNAQPDVYRRRTPLAAAMPTADELLHHFEARRGAPVDGLTWFDALARFKSAATWSLILKRAARAGASTYDDIVPVVPRVLAAAVRMAEG